MLGGAAVAGGSLPLLRGLLTGGGVAPAAAEMPAGHAGMSMSGAHPAMNAEHAGLHPARRSTTLETDSTRLSWSATSIGARPAAWPAVSCSRVELAATDKDIEVAPGSPTRPGSTTDASLARPCAVGRASDCGFRFVNGS